MRLFIGIELNKSAREELVRSIEALKKISRGNYTLPANLHLTLQFLGEKQPGEVAAVKEAMRTAVQGFSVMDLRLSEPGRFARGNESIFWYGITGSLQPLQNLVQALKQSLAEHGISFEEGAFRPHITLGRRVKADLPVEEVFSHIKASPAAFTVSEMVLFESTRVNSVLTYMPVYRQKFALL